MTGKKRTLLVVTVVVLLAVPVVAVAADRFTDVPSTNIFHDDIAWLADAGITLGCNPPINDEFCPEEPVKRQQMAAFMRRFAENVNVAGGADALIQPGPAQSPFQADVFTIDTVVPGGIVVNLALNCESKSITTDTRWDVDITIDGIQAVDKAAVLYFDPDIGLSRIFANAAATSYTAVGAGTHRIGVRAENKPIDVTDPDSTGDGNLQCDISQTAVFVP